MNTKQSALSTFSLMAYVPGVGTPGCIMPALRGLDVAARRNWVTRREILQDPEGNTTQFAYDGANRLVLSTNSLSKSKSYAFDMAGNLARTSDRNGRVIQYQYDDLGRQTAEDWQQSSTIPTLTVGTTQDGGSLDEQQSIGWSTTAFGMSGTYTISHNGQTTAAIAWNATAATIQTALEGLSSIGSDNISVTVTSPNTYSRTLSLTFRNGKGGTNVAQTTITTTGLMPVFSTVTPFNTTSVTGGVYSETQTITLANATGGTWRVAYNGEISGQLSPSISATDFKTVLDGFSGIDSASVTSSAGSFTVTFGGTQSSVNMSQIFGDAANASCGSTIRTISTTYDANDQILSQSDPSATINYTLDNLGRATAISNSISGLTPAVAFTQSFDAAGNRTELKATIGSTLDFKNTYQYDALNRLVETIQQGQSGGNAVTSKRVTQSYNALSQRTGVSRYQSTGTSNPVASTSFSFDTANRLTDIAHQQGSTTLSSYVYTYDNLSRIASVTSSIDGLSTYTYDVSSQLTGADRASQTDEAYDYDDNGNRDSSGYTTSSNNRTTAAPGFTYTYDDEGNRTSRTNTSTGAVQETTWDYRNRLTKVVNRASSGGAITQQVDYEYDANNRMVNRALDADGAGFGSPTTQYWAYDHGINALLEFDGSSSSDLSHRYVWSSQVDELFADEQVTSPSTAGNSLWALSDHLNSIRDIADFNESTAVTSITNHRTLTATGTVVAETNAAVDLLYAFTGKQLDDATGLQHNLFRWYDSVLGQWLSEDPLGFAAGDENLRRYISNSPVDRLDSSGLQEPDSTTQIVLPVMSPEVTYPQSMALNPSSIRMLQVDLFRQSGRAIDTTQLARGCIGLALARAGYASEDVGTVSPWLLRHQGTAYRDLSDALAAQIKLNTNYRAPTFNVVALQIRDSAIFRDGFLQMPDMDLSKYNFSTYVGNGWFEYINGSFVVINGQIDVQLTRSSAGRTPRVILTRELPESYGDPLYFLLPTRRPGGLPPRHPF